MRTQRIARASASTAVLLAFILALGGCIDAVHRYREFDIEAPYQNPGVFPGRYPAGDQSGVLFPGNLTFGQPEVFELKSTLPALPGNTDSSEALVYIPLAVWRPNTSFPVPVIVDAGPYFEVGTHCEIQNNTGCVFVNNTIDYAAPGGPTDFLLRNYLPLGYAVVQLAVRGTGTAGGCLDLMGLAERHDLDQAITWLGEQPWSNGKVAMIGGSYDGSTPWEVAGTGNPHLKTIVPIAGLSDIFDLMWHNGTSESRAATMYTLTYWPYGFDGTFPNPLVWSTADDVASRAGAPVAPSAVASGLFQAKGRQPYQDRQNLMCRNVAEAPLISAYSVASGNRGSEVSSFWTERNWRDDVLRNYTGSVFLIHGLQDWNVDPHEAIPFNAQLREKGVPLKEWYGQWGHAAPDSTCQKVAPFWLSAPCRTDYAEVLLRWFEKYLHDNKTAQLGPAIQVMDDLGYWRNADSFPSKDVTWTSFYVTGEHKLATAPGGTSTTFTLLPPDQNGALNYLELKSDPMQADTKISGLPQLKLPYEAQGPGGFVDAWLFDEDSLGHVRALWTYNAMAHAAVPVRDVPEVRGHAVMDLRYRDGGETMSVPAVAGQRYVANMEFEPMESVIPKGDRMTVWVFQQPFFDRAVNGVGVSPPSPVKLVLGGSGSVFRVPVLNVDATAVFPVPGSHFPVPAEFWRLYKTKPPFSDRFSPPTAQDAAQGCEGGELAVPSCDPVRAAP